jgi:hypothetical protein
MPKNNKPASFHREDAYIMKQLHDFKPRTRQELERTTPLNYTDVAKSTEALVELGLIKEVGQRPIRYQRDCTTEELRNAIYER